MAFGNSKLAHLQRNIRRDLKSQLTGVVLITLINFFVIGNYIYTDRWLHGLGYFLFFYFSMFVIYVTKGFVHKKSMIVRKPRKELLIAVIFIIIGTLALALRYYIQDQQNIGALVQIPIMLLVLVFTFPVGIAVYLLLRKNKLRHLGFGKPMLKPLGVGIVVWLITGLCAWIFNSDGILWSMAMKEFGGILGLVIQGIVGAALVEEFWRFVVQSRLNALLNKSLISILLASMVWALMHLPMTFSKTHDLAETILYCVQILPIGVVWGYLTHATGSLLPAIFAHGLNLWGIQNQ